MSDLVVEVKEGKIRGVVEKNVDGGEYLVFRGIPYAEPPIGNLRFKVSSFDRLIILQASLRDYHVISQRGFHIITIELHLQDPRPPQAWSGVRDAGEIFPKGVQYDITSGLQSGSEDCLYLNVATNSLAGKRPVMVWIHGGGFNSGSANNDFHSPDYLLKHDIVFVGITYRLGCFGFLNLDLPDASGNQALKDQVAGLRWVQENIGAFGGDPGNVTMFGHSAGAACIHLITLSPLTKGLFHKVVLQSSVANNPYVINPEPVKTGLKLAETAKKKTNDPAEALKYLMTLSTIQLIEAQETMDDPNDMFAVIMSFTPSIDAKSNQPIMPESPIEMIMKHGIDVPVIIGFTSEEGIPTMLGPKGPSFREINTNFASNLARDLRIRDVDRLKNVADAVRNYYFGEYMVSLAEYKNEYAQLKGDVIFVNGIQQFIDVQSEKSTPTYIYRFSYTPSYPTVRKLFTFEIEGTCHCDELNAIFHNNLLMSDTAHQEKTTDRLVMKRLTRMWTDFAKTGFFHGANITGAAVKEIEVLVNPTPELDELIPCKWEPLTKERRNYLEINDQLTPGVNPNEASWKFWKTILDTLQWRVGG